jgi:hypothetical protein
MVVAPVGLLDAVVLDHSGRVSSTSAIGFGSFCC